MPTRRDTLEEAASWAPKPSRPNHAAGRTPEADAMLLQRIRQSERPLDELSKKERLLGAVAAVTKYGIGKRIAARAYRINEGVLRTAVKKVIDA